MAAGWKNATRYQNYFLNIYSVYKGREDVKAFLEIILTIVTITVFIVFALRPTVLTIASLTKTIETKQETVAKMDVKIENLNIAQKLLGEKSGQIKTLTSALPTEALPQDYLQQVELAAGKNGVSVTSLSLNDVIISGKPPKDAGSRGTTKKLSELPRNTKGMLFSVAVTGSFPNLIAFAADIENLRRPIWIDSILVATSTTIDGPILTLTVNGRIVFLGGNDE